MRCGMFVPLALRSELIAIKKFGELIHTQSFIIKYIKIEQKECKLAFSVRKKIGNAVIRNLIKRRLRESLRHLVMDKKNGINCLIIAKQEILSYPFEKLDYEINKAFSKIFKHMDAT